VPVARVAIVGGGVTGLAAAHRLRELRPEVEVVLYEAADRLGGLIGTAEHAGCVIEAGPDSMITDKPWGLALARRLGLEAELIGTNSAHRRSFVVRRGKLLPVPEGFQLLAPSRFGPLIRTPIFSPAGKLRMGLDLLLPRRRAAGDESLGHFVLRRLGREALERMAQPMIAGIYGADPMHLSLAATLPRFLEMERDHGSVIRAMWARGRAAARAGAAAGGVSGARYGLFVSFRRGMQTLTDALVRSLPPGAARAGTEVTALERDQDRWLVRSAAGAEPADSVILALPAYRSAELLRPLEPALADLLAAVPHAASATMTVAYRREDVPHPLDGFGFVAPAVEGLSLLGCTFSHVKWPGRAPEGIALLRAFVGGPWVAAAPEAEMERRVRADYRTLLGVTAEPLFVRTWRGERAMPQYEVGHLDRVAEMERRAAALGVTLAGNSYRGVGIPDSIRSGEAAAEAAVAG
jgi:oxygen-dependent protoporphyrinogen oxidase